MIDEKQKSMICLLDYIHNNHAISEVSGMSYFSQFIKDLKEYDFAEVLAYQSKKFQLNYVLNFVLSTHLIWAELSDLDWLRVMSSLNPRPDPYKQLIGEADFTDVYFLCKFIRVNAIEFFLTEKSFFIEDKKRILKYSKKVVDTLFMDELDIEDLDGIFWTSIHDIDNMRDILIEKGRFKPLNYNLSELKEYIEQEIREKCQ